MPLPSTSSKPSLAQSDYPRISHRDLAVISGIVHSLPNAEQFKTGNLNLDEMVEGMTKALVDESQWKMILQLTGDTAVRAIECLDRVGKIRSHS